MEQTFLEVELVVQLGLVRAAEAPGPAEGEEVPDAVVGAAARVEVEPEAEEVVVGHVIAWEGV